MGCINGEVVDSCTEGNPAADDTTCNGIDEDCDGEVDEEYVETPTTCGEGACSDAGAAPIANEAADVVAGSSSTIVVGGVGAAFVGFFAFFAAAVGLNTTKQDASEPLAAMLEESEVGSSAFINPTFVDGAGAQNNVMGV